MSLQIPAQRAPIGDLYGPFFRVKFYSSFFQFKQAEKEEFGKRIERKRPGSFTARSPENQPPTSVKEFANQNIHQGRSGLALNEFQLDKFAASLEMKMVGSERTTVTLALTPPYDAAMEILDGNLIDRDTVMLVEFGYASRGGANDILSGPYLFRATAPAATFGEAITITISGEDILSSSLGRQFDKKTFSRKDFPTDLDIIEDFAEKHGLEVNSALVVANSPLRSTEKKDLEQNVDGWLFFQRLLTSNQASYFLHGRQLIVSDNALRTFSESAAYRLLWRAKLSDSFDVPLKSWDSTYNKDLFNPASAKSIKYARYDRDLGVINNEVIDASDIKGETNLGKKVTSGDKGGNKAVTTPAGIAKSPAIADDQAGFTLSAPNTDQQATGIARGIAKDAAILTGITAVATIPGIVSLQPNQLVLVDGLGKYFKGTYMVTQIEHKLDSGGFESSLSLHRTSIGVAGEKAGISSRADKPKGPTSLKPKKLENTKGSHRG